MEEGGKCEGNTRLLLTGCRTGDAGRAGSGSSECPRRMGKGQDMDVAA